MKEPNHQKIGLTQDAIKEILQQQQQQPLQKHLMTTVTRKSTTNAIILIGFVLG